MKNKINLLIIGILICSLLPIGMMNFTGPPEIKESVITKRTNTRSYEVESQILIDNNSHFIDMATANDWPGDGSSTTPYRIEGLSITEPGICIRIMYVTLYFVISGCYLNSTVAGWEAVEFFNTLHGKIEDSYVFGGFKGIAIYSSQNSVIDNCTVADSFHDGIGLDSGHKTSIIGCEVTDSTDIGINVYNSDDVIIQETVVQDSGEQGVFVNYSDNCTLSGDFIHDNDNDGIYVYQSYLCNITGSDIFGNLGVASDGGIYSSSSTYGTASNNNIYDNRYQGIYLTSSNSWTLLNNRIYNNTDYGILSLSSDNAIFIGNNISLNSWDAPGEGLYVSGCHNLNAIGNRIFDNHERGVFVVSSDDVLFADNEIDRNGFEGLFLYTLNRPQIIGNHVFNNSQDGIYLNGAINATIDGNNVTYSGDVSNGFLSDNIGLYACERATITNNDVAEAYGPGIEVIYTSYYHTISYNHAHDNTAGIATAVGVQNSTIHGNIIHDNDVGISMTYAEYSNITDNIIYDCTKGINLARNVSYCILRGNDIGWTGSQVSENDNPSELCKDNVWDYNWWYDYSGTGNYTVSSLSEDHYPSKSLDLVAGVPFEYEITSTGNTMEWGASAKPLSADHYIYSVNGTSFGPYDWDGQDITLNLDGLSAGYNEIQLSIFHISGHGFGLTSHVNVSDETSPVWTIPPQDASLHPGEVFAQGLLAEDPSGISTYWVNDTVNFAITELGLLTNNTILGIGDYGLRVYVNDTFGHVTDYEIRVRVYPSTTTTIQTTTSITTTTTTTSTQTTPETTPSTTTSSTQLPGDNTLLLLLIGVGGIIVLVVVILVLRKRGS